MSDTKQKEDSARNVPVPEPRTVCHYCGHDESGTWRWSTRLGRLVCDDCYHRNVTPSPTTPAVKQP
jgi:hypothetical protein